LSDYKVPHLIPRFVDYDFLEPPAIVNLRDVQGVNDRDGGTTYWLLTEYNAGVRYHNAGVYSAEPGKGFAWHTHPEETEEEEQMYIVRGTGKLVYKKNRTDYEIEFKKGQAIYSGHLTHRLENTGNEPLLIFFMIAPLPLTTIVYGGLRDRGLGFVDYAHLDPPVVGVPENTPIFHFGNLENRKLIDADKAGMKHMDGIEGVIEKVGLGSMWHTHTIESGQEDIFYICNGKGSYVYIKQGKIHVIPFREGDAIFSKHLTNYTWNSGQEDIEMATAIAPRGSKVIRHSGDMSTLYTHR